MVRTLPNIRFNAEMAGLEEMKRIIFVQLDHLHQEFGALANSNPAEDLIVFVESQRMLTGRRWHIQRLQFMISAARHFARDLTQAGYQVLYSKAATTSAGLSEVCKKYPKLPVWSTEPSSRRMQEQLQALGVKCVPNDFFLTSRAEFSAWATSQKSLLMENFYRQQRVRLDILVEGAKPVGGAWNFDEENRLPPPKKHKYPKYLRHTPDEIDQQVLDELLLRKDQLWGKPALSEWGTTRQAALKQLQHFLTHKFADFGPYEDAMPAESWSVYHSLLSPYMNVGLLHASEIITAVKKRYAAGDIPLSSCEGFVRQVIGWREYINGLYWHFSGEYRNLNGLNAKRNLLPLYQDPEKTQMNCIRSIVSDVHERAWVHHIPRLMILSNLALLSGIDPQQFLDWMRESFIDASEWVMVPNVIGMGVHADGGKMMTKPYASGGAYISRMSNYCSSCKFNPKLRAGETACPFSTLYWDFLDRHREQFSKNFRMAQQVKGLDRLSDLPQLRQRATEVLALLERGEL